MSDVAKRLYALGFNVICVTRDKKPYGSWSASSRDESPPDCDENVAVTGNFFANEEWKILIVDVDNPSTEVLAKAFGEGWQGYLCGQPWSFCVRTGARPKGRVLCENGDCAVYKDKSMKEVEAVVPASQVERGLAVVVRVPNKCVKKDFSTVRGGDVELIFNNYQVVYGVHPSGVRYEFVRWDGEKFAATESVGEGVVISCEEFHRLVGAIRTAGREETAEERYEPPTSWTESIADPDRLLAKLKRWWGVETPDGRRFHDSLVFGVASIMWRYGVKKEETEQLWEQLFQWALENGLDSEPDIRHHRSVVKWVYDAPQERRRWGRKRLREVILEILEAIHGEEIRPEVAEAEYDEILSAIGVKRRRPEDASGDMCVVISRVVDENGYETPTVWLCNNAFGITVMRAERKKRKEGNAEREVMVTKETKVRDVHIVTATVYRDIYLGREYVDAVLATKNVTQTVKMYPKSMFVERLNREYSVTRSPEWSFLMNYFPQVEDVIISGFFCPPDEGPYAAKVPCKVRDYFGVGIRPAEKPQAREALEATLGVLHKFSPTDELYTTYATALAHGLAQSFFLARKAWRSRPAFVAFEGPRSVGKTTIAMLTLYALYPERANELLVGAYASLSAARIGRLSNSIVAGHLVLDEQRIVMDKPEVVEVLKTMLTSMVAWRTAFGEQWPAYSGIVLTANRFDVRDPELADKIYKVPFPTGIDMRKRTEFALALQQIHNILPNFGGYYLYYAEKNWPAVKDVVLKPTQAEAADEYFRIIADELGVSIPRLPDLSGSYISVMESSVKERFVQYVWEVLRPQMSPVDRDGAISITAALERALELGRVPFMRLFKDDHVLIERGITERLDTNMATLCEQLGGQPYKKSNNPRYYGTCVIEKVELFRLLEEVPEEGDAEEGHDQA